MARGRLVKPGVGERLLTSKLQILNGTGNRRPSAALSMLTGRIGAHLPLLEYRSLDDEAVPAVATAHRAARQYAARTVYLSADHLSAIDRIIEAWQQVEPRRLTRSAVLRRAVEHLRTAVAADPDKFTLESE